jgi:hypothetical protein
MDFRNEKSKIYFLGCKFFAIAVFILMIFSIINRNNRVLSSKLFILQQLSLSLLLILSGTRSVLAEKDNKGYFNCILGGIMLVMIMGFFLVKCF